MLTTEQRRLYSKVADGIANRYIDVNNAFHDYLYAALSHVVDLVQVVWGWHNEDNGMVEKSLDARVLTRYSEFTRITREFGERNSAFQRLEGVERTGFLTRFADIVIEETREVWVNEQIKPGKIEMTPAQLKYLENYVYGVVISKYKQFWPDQESVSFLRVTSEAGRTMSLATQYLNGDLKIEDIENPIHVSMMSDILKLATNLVAPSIYKRL